MFSGRHYMYDIDKVIASIKNILAEKYIEEFIDLLEKNELKFQKSVYTDLDQKLFIHIAKKSVDRIINNKKNEIIEYIENDYKPQEILPLVCDRFFSEQRAMSFIKNYYKENDLVSPDDKKVYVLFGIFSIFSGMFLMTSIVGIFTHILHGIKLITKSSKKLDK